MSIQEYQLSEKVQTKLNKESGGSGLEVFQAPPSGFIYFDTVNGNDANEGTEANPKKNVVQYINDMSHKYIPQNVSIKVLNNDRIEESIGIYGTVGHQINIDFGGDANTKETQIANRLILSECSNPISIRGVTPDRSISANSCFNVEVNECHFNWVRGIEATGSRVYVMNSKFNNFDYAIMSNSEAIVFSESNSGNSANPSGVAYRGFMGGVVKVSNCAITANALKMSSRGGQVLDV